MNTKSRWLAYYEYLIWPRPSVNQFIYWCGHLSVLFRWWSTTVSETVSETVSCLQSGYEAIPFTNNETQKNVNVAVEQNRQATGRTPGATGGGGGTTADELQVPQSARSTLSGQSWLSDSRWSEDDDDDDMGENVMQKSFGHLGAVKKTPKSSNAAAVNWQTLFTVQLLNVY